MKLMKNPRRTEWAAICERPAIAQSELEPKVRAILDDVRREGDRAVLRCIERFENRKTDSFRVDAQAIARAEAEVPPPLKSAIATAMKNVERFHAAQGSDSARVETTKGVTCWWRDVPLERVGIYVPAGTAPLISTLVMLAVPARVAGCREIVLCSPATQTGSIDPAILYIAALTGIEEVLCVGGAQAVGALAYGTETVRPVSKIFGPGNQFVTCAKQLVSREGVLIDMPAGPSELEVIADASARPEWVAADLLSQAEHGWDSQVLLVSDDLPLLDGVQRELDRQLETLPRAELARRALESSRAVLVADLNEAVDLTNEYAPEHLIIAVSDPALLASRIANAASVFLGHYSPESAGDYASGTNHVLPTNGFARSIGGLNLSSFMKRITFQELTKEGLETLGPAIETLAAAEGLEAHRRAVSIRRGEKI